MATRFTARLRSQLFNTLCHNPQLVLTPAATLIRSQPIFSSLSDFHHQINGYNSLRFLSTARRHPARSNKVDIGARARQLQNRRLWTYALTFSCIAGFIVIVLNNFQDQLVFYVTPTEALEKYQANPTKTKFRLGGLVLEGSVAHPASSPDIEFVITDLITDILVRYQGSLPDLFREGHSVVVEGFVKPFTEEIKNLKSNKNVSEKARNGDCYFAAIEVLAKHDEKYMPPEVAAAIEKNKKIIEEQQQGVKES
ncbi:cytochrome c-type biogenesis protein CcmE homolog, mitochondrial-like [Mangifera indica]|uniref:cytochrome c-type biogenesis protein CcmE homolog, mitochondrial-like n=1 Tax=Mangifera indica TaxID=29780 RepID=UPI001CFB2EF3|nr:cytochrome c-type biogenesis protein CcmE homolog, mitochondrial-like [Mangifera indica]XP_044470741.1 cytochrome c-type biogenesis protein CcmE homolog, mitochondrial-like [Mangifera indica]